MPAMSAEVSRSLVNYTHDWHQPRQALTMAGLVFFWHQSVAICCGALARERQLF